MNCPASTSRKRSDPLEIFLNAERFKAAAGCLGALLRENDWRELFVPMHVNAALALELYLKCLLALKSCQIPPSHHHGKLFSQLPAPYKRSLIRRFREYAKNDEELIWSHKQDPRYATDLESVLNDSGNIFETLRYLYEGGLPLQMRACFTVTIRFFRDELIVLQPSWVASSEVLHSTHIPLTLNPSTKREARVSPFGRKSITNPPPSSSK